MLINELTHPTCEACGDEIDVLDAGFEPVTPLLCPDCRLQLVFDGERQEIAKAA
jgi:hypothetical protein